MNFSPKFKSCVRYFFFFIAKALENNASFFCQLYYQTAYTKAHRIKSLADLDKWERANVADALERCDFEPGTHVVEQVTVLCSHDEDMHTYSW